MLIIARSSALAAGPNLFDLVSCILIPDVASWLPTGPRCWLWQEVNERLRVRLGLHYALGGEVFS